jgi:hypothetical protein
LFDFYHDTGSEFWNDLTDTSMCLSPIPVNSISSSFSSPSPSDLDSLDFSFDSTYLTPPLPHSQPRSSPTLSFTDSEIFPPLLVLTSLHHAEQEFSSILGASARLIPHSQVPSEEEALDQVTKHQALSSRLHQFRSAFDNYEIFNSSFYSPQEARTAKALRVNTLGLFIFLATLSHQRVGYEIFDAEFEEIVRLCEELVAEEAEEGEWASSLRQVALYCRDRGVKRRAVLLLSYCMAV